MHAAVTAAAREAADRVCGAAVVTCRFTHVYPDGPAPYYGVYAPGRWGSLVEQWDEVKASVSRAIVDHGGTITHHHAVGRDHRPWYDEQRPDAFAAALSAAKSVLDPAGVLNPGVLLDADRQLGCLGWWQQPGQHVPPQRRRRRAAGPRAGPASRRVGCPRDRPARAVLPRRQHRIALG
jgi:hypothetical protein